MMRVGSRRLIRRCGALLTLAVVAGGCSADGSGSSPGPTATSTAADEPVPLPSLAAVPPGLPASIAPGLVTVTGSTGDPRDARFTTVFDVPGVPAYRDTASSVVGAIVARYSGALAGVPDESARHGRLTITSEVVAAGGPVLGLQIGGVFAAQQGVDQVVRTTSTAYVVLPERSGDGPGEVVTSAQLLTDAGRTAFTEAVVDVLAADPVLSTGHADVLAAELTVDEAAIVIGDLRITADGSVVAVLSRDSGLTDPGAGDVAVQVPENRADAWLSPAGHRVVSRLHSGNAFTGLPAAPTGAASPTGPAPLSPAPPGAVDCTVQACIALTFDDGPGPYTSRLLDELAAADVHATFFVVGQNVATRPDVVRRAAAEGHEIGNHTWDHPELTTLDRAGVDDELDRAAQAVVDAIGTRPSIVRPPYGSLDDDVAAGLADRGEAAVTWDVDTLDWQNRDAAETTSRALAGASPGSIVLMHDIHPSTVDAVPVLVDQLRQRGYTFVTVSQLLGTDLDAGAAYARGPEPH